MKVEEIILYVLLVILGAMIVTLLVLKARKGVERYGGPIKNLRAIPRSECEGLCDRFYRRCMYDHRYVDGAENYCGRKRDACKLECHYSRNYGRM